MTADRRVYAITRSVTALLALSLTVISCGGSSGVKEEPVLPPVVSIKTQAVTGEAGSQFLTVTASGNWTITTSAPWITVNPSSGSGNSATVVLSYSENTDAIRNATVTVTSSGGSSTASITQSKLVVPDPVQPPGPTPDPGGDDPGGGGDPSHGTDSKGYGFKTAPQTWLELPQTKEDDGLEFFTASMTVGAVKTRNFSFYWDYDNLVSWWVAYPLCSWNIGSSVKRTDAWQPYDTNWLPEKYQPVLKNGFRDGNASYIETIGDGNDGKPEGRWRARGHQIPSADRLTSYDSNAMTFCYINMTPQINKKFNSSIWATLETKVRNWAISCDTLYVVTGCVPVGSEEYCFDNAGKKVTVPVAYFKAVLGYKKNPPGTAWHNGFIGNAFYLVHKEYDSSKISKEMSMSIADLEKKLGYKLFVNLDAKVGAETAKAIKEENPASVSWWW